MSVPPPCNSVANGDWLSPHLSPDDDDDEVRRRRRSPRYREVPRPHGRSRPSQAPRELTPWLLVCLHVDLGILTACTSISSLGSRSDHQLQRTAIQRASTISCCSDPRTDMLNGIISPSTANDSLQDQPDVETKFSANWLTWSDHRSSGVEDCPPLVAPLLRR